MMKATRLMECLVPTARETNGGMEMSSLIALVSLQNMLSCHLVELNGN